MKENKRYTTTSRSRKIYQKQNLDDMDSFESLSQDPEDLSIPGLENMDTGFDFTEEDELKFRKRSLGQDTENYEDDAEVRTKENARPVRSVDDGYPDNRKKARRAPEKKAIRTPDRESPADGETVFISLQKRKSTNKEIMHIMYLVVAIFLGTIGYFVYFQVVTAPNIVNNVYNPRLAKMAEMVKRGDIVSADGEILATSIVNEDGSQTRQYPYDCVFAHVVGTSDINKSGIELSEDMSLITSDLDPLDKLKNDIMDQKNPGNTVKTTLNAKLQQVAHDALADRSGAVVALEPSTGKVLALISKPDYDANTLLENYDSILEDEASKVLLNQATQGLFVPGSIFKVVTSLAYLRSDLSRDAYGYYCDGYITLDSDDGESYLRCYGGEEHGSLDLTDSFAESCNASYANIGTMLPDGLLAETAEDLYFGKKLPTAFTTAVSKFELKSTDTPWQTGATAIGQGDTVISPMHAAMIASAIANGGTIMEPYVVDSVVTADGHPVKQYDAKKGPELMTKSEAETLSDMMQAVINYGTGYGLAYRNYTCAGKTGTGEVAGSGNNAWFIGFAPAEDPQIAVAVLVEDTEGTSSLAAVPIAGEIFDCYLNQD